MPQCGRRVRRAMAVSPPPGDSGLAPASSGDPAAVAHAFISAIAWGEHTTVWELLSETGRSVALAVAQVNGLDRVAAGRIRDRLANPVELEDFLAQLLGGLRHDLRGVDIGEIRPGRCVHAPGGVSATVALLVPSLLPGTDSWRAGNVVCSDDGSGVWRVDRLEPVLAGP